MSRYSAPLDYNPVTERTTTFHRLEDGDWAISYTGEDVAPLLDHNKMLQNHGPMPGSFGSTKNELGLRKVASIPPSVQLKWYVEKGVEVWNPAHEQAVTKLLNDAEWRYLRTDNTFLAE